MTPKTIQKLPKNEPKTAPRGLLKTYPPRLWWVLAAKRPQEASKTAQERSKTALEAAKRAPRRPKMAPRRPQDAPRQP